MSNLFRPRASFLTNTAWQNQALNALHYNTSQQGSVLPLIYGTCRQQVNLIDLNNYRGPKGKKGKSGSLPISGTHQTGKGGGSGKGKGGKKNAHYTVCVDFAICQGPVPGGTSESAVYSSAGVESFSSSGLNFHNGADGQPADSWFTQVNYSGTCHVTGTPLDLGQSPVLPNIAFEVTGLMAGVNTGGYPKESNPGDVILDFLTNPRYGAGFPSECVSQINHSDSVANTYGDYCQAALLGISTSLDGHQKAIEWLSGIVTLTNSALVWSGRLLKIVPYGDLTLDNNGSHWEPNWTINYDLTDMNFLPSSPHQEGAQPNPGDDDPITMTRSNPADADNWFSIEYTDRNNFYNSTTLTVFDQGAIDTYGLRIGDSVPGRPFSNQTSAQISLQLMLQRRVYIRNTGIKFNLGWQFCLLEPMDLVSLTGRVGDKYLDQYAVRITSVEEDDNGNLTFVCEDPQEGVAAPVVFPNISAISHPGSGGLSYGWPAGPVLVTDPAYDSVYDFRSTRPPDSSTGTLSAWLSTEPARAPLPPGTLGPPTDSGDTIGQFLGLLQTATLTGTEHNELTISIDYNGAVILVFGGAARYISDDGAYKCNGIWHHILVTWDLPTRARVWIDGSEFLNTLTAPVYPSTVTYSTESRIFVFGKDTINGFRGCSNDFWWDSQTNVEDPGQFRNLNGTPKNLGERGENPLSRPPNIFLHYPATLDQRLALSSPQWPGNVVIGSGYYGINRAGDRPDDGAYWVGVHNPSHATSGPGSSATWACDPAYPNLDSSFASDIPMICSYPFLPYT